MSCEHVSEVLNSAATIGLSRLVMVTIASRANDAGQVSISMAELARLTMISRRHLVRLIDDLVSLEELDIVAPSAGTRAAVYAVRGDTTSPLEIARDDTVSPLANRRGDTVSPLEEASPLQKEKSNRVSNIDIYNPPIIPPRKTRSKKTTLPDCWQPNEHALSIAVKEGYNDAEREIILEQFRSSNIAHGRRYADWDRAFYNWIRSGYTRKDIETRRTSRSSGGSIVDVARELLADRAAVV